MPKAYNRARVPAKQPAAKRDYVIVDPGHRPDMRGEFGGAKVALVAGKQVVRLSEAQAKFYLDSGVIRPA